MTKKITILPTMPARGYDGVALTDNGKFANDMDELRASLAPPSHKPPIGGKKNDK